MKYKISKRKAEEFCKALCGTAKGLKEGSTGHDWILLAGHMSYNFWLLDSRIYCQILVGCDCISSFYFNLETYEPDFEFNDRINDQWKRKEEKSDRYDFLVWLTESKYNIRIPDELFEKYRAD